MKQKLIGRVKEQEILKKALNSKVAELISIVGRRRVSKTFLVQQVYDNHIVFELTGIQHAPRMEQLQNFAIQLKKYSKSTLPIASPQNWLSAFYLLSEFLENQQQSKKNSSFSG